MATRLFFRYSLFLKRTRYSSSLANNGTNTTGLFSNPLLVSPEGFDTLTESTITNSVALVQQILQSNTSLRTLQLFDELSDTLCRAADLAECIRLLHPEEEFVKKAESCCVVLGKCVEQLNTKTDLYEALKRVSYNDLDEVSIRHGTSLLHDFHINGIHLSAQKRAEVVRLNQSALSLSHTFMYQCTEPFKIQLNEAPPIIKDNAQLFTVDDTNSLHITHIPYTSDNEELKKQCYLYYYSPLHPNKHVLDQLLMTRHQLAILSGYETFAHRALKDTMAGSPERVMEFLDLLTERIMPLAQEEVREMSGVKGSPVVHPWDYTSVFQKTKEKLFGRSVNVSDYFSLQSCLNGLKKLFNDLFDVQMVSSVPLAGETWDPSVKKYTFLHHGTILGHLYCDWYSRNDKTASDCQFTIQGSRLDTNGNYQLPISALSLSLPPPQGECLANQHVHNIFHEMGHAIHSILGQSPYQNTSGTRCPTDYAEVPSNLMELFLQDSRVLESFAQHYKTNQTITPEAMSLFRISTNLYPAFSTQQQILYSVMDQRFHGTHPLNESSTESYAHLHDKYSPVQYTPNTAWFLRFVHLYMYAAKYYSYLWSRSVANLIWRKCFKDDPFSRAQGEVYRTMLAQGGGIHSLKLVKDMIGYEPTVKDLVDAHYEEIMSIKDRQLD